MRNQRNNSDSIDMNHSPSESSFISCLDSYTRRQRKSIPDNNNITADMKSIACERIKTNIIYILIMLIVILVGVLCFALVILFEEKSDVLESMLEKEIITEDLSEEQRTWYENAFNELRDSIHFKRNERKAKNVILFVGDGMGLSTVTASRIYKYGEEGHLTWDSFPNFGLLKVITINNSFVIMNIN